MDSVFRNTDGRRFMRVPFKRAVRFSAYNGGERFDSHIAQDLSQGGLRMLSSEFMPVNSLVSIQIQLKDREKIMDVEGRVKWVRYNPMTETYQMGVEFVDDAAFQRAMIGEFIQAK
jgi:c-di-GMP-binding flagellar brake protein YcgR